MFVAGIAGFFMRRSGYSVAGIVLGLILGKIGEKAFAQSMQIVQYDFIALMQRPIAAVLLIAAVGTIIWNVYKALRGTRHLISEGQAKRSEEHTSELQSLMRISYAVFCLKKKTRNPKYTN